MKFVSPLTEDEIITLNEMHKNASTHRLRQRAYMLMLSNRGYKMNELSKLLELDRDTISLTFDAWEKQGLSGLYDKPKSGRKPIFNSEQEQLIVDKIEGSPSQLKGVVSAIEAETGKSASVDTIKRIAKKKGLKWKRIKKQLKGKPNKEEYAEKKAKLSDLKRQASNGDIDLYFQDESGFSMTPVVPYAWQYIGENILINSSRSQQINALGFLSLKHDLRSMTFMSNINSDCVIHAIEALFPQVEKETWIVMDNAPTHTSNKFMEKIKDWAKRKIKIMFLPPYSSQLNPIEILWRFIKYYWLKPAAYESFENLQNALNEVLATYGKKYRITFA